MSGIDICIDISSVFLSSPSDDSLREKKKKNRVASCMEIEGKRIIVVTEILTHVWKMRGRWKVTATSKRVEGVMVQ